MRTIKLTHEEIEMVQNSLQYAYDCKIGNLKQNAKLITNEERENIVSWANKYFDLFDEIKQGQKDI